MAESNQVSVIYVPEVTLGVTPTTGTWETLRYTSFTPNTTVNTTESAEIRSDRMISDMPKVSTTIGASADFELSPTTFDTLLEAAMCGTWTTDVLKIGTENRSFSLETEMIMPNGTSKFINQQGMRVGTMDLNINFGEIVTGSFGFAGTGFTTPASTQIGTGTVTAPTSTEPVTASSQVGTVKIDTVATSICISAMSVSLDNGLREINCIGSDTPSDQRKGTARVTGSVTMYLDVDSFAIYEKMLNNDNIEFEFTVDDGVNSYVVLIPKAKLSGDAPSVDGLDSDLMLEVSFTGLYDSVTGTSLQITRT